MKFCIETEIEQTHKLKYSFLLKKNRQYLAPFLDIIHHIVFPFIDLINSTQLSARNIRQKKRNPFNKHKRSRFLLFSPENKERKGTITKIKNALYLFFSKVKTSSHNKGRREEENDVSI